MTPQELIAAFETLAEAPEGIKRLRELVLRLAVTGKLLPQNTNDVPSAGSLATGRVVLESGAAGVRRGSWKRTAPVAPSEAPFVLPRGWAWARINDTGYYINGLAFKPSDWKKSGRPIIRIQNLSDPTKPFNFAEGDFPDDVIVRTGDLLVSWSATLDAFVWTREEAVLNQHIFRVKPCREAVFDRFLYFLLRQAIRDLADGEHAHGLVMAHINRGPFLDHVVGLPPLAEQHRIVAKVDELMALLDRLESAHEARNRTRTAARDAALAALREAADASEVEAAWTRVATRLPALCLAPEDVKPFRQAVLELGIRGRLVPQAREDEEAGVLLARIRSKRMLMGRRAAMPEDPNGDEFTDADTSFAIPGSWCWTRFGEICATRLGKMLDKAKNTGPLRPYLRNANLQWFRFDLSDMLEMRLEDAELAEHSIRKGDLLICEGGEPGRAAVCDESAEGMVFQKALHRARPRGDISTWYLAYLLRCDTWSGRIQSRFTGATIKHFTGQSLETYPVPLPPLAEQHRIVAKVDELMALLDRLEAQLTAASASQQAFASAAVAHFDEAA